MHGILQNISSWLLSPNTGDTVIAVSNATAILLYLWLLKIYLGFWLFSVKGLHPLTDVPRWSIPFLGAADLVMCLGLGMTYWALMKCSRVVIGVPNEWVKAVLPTAIGGLVVIFSLVSCRVNQIYGAPLDIDHLRAARSLRAMRESIAANVDRFTVSLLTIGLGLAVFGGRALEPLFRELLHGFVRLEIWLAIFSLGGIYGLIAYARLRGCYVYGLKQNGVLFFLRYFQRPIRAVDVVQRLRKMPAEAIRCDSELRMAGSLFRAGEEAAGVGLRALGSGRDFNVLLLLLESTSAQHVNQRTMPNLMRLRSRGLSFANHFTSVCETYKVIYSLFYSDHMVELGGLPREIYGGPMPQPSLAQILRNAGYATAFFHTGNLGFADKPFVLDGFGTQVGAELLRKQGATSWAWGVFEEHGVFAMSDWIAARKNERFFAVYSTIFPHHPYLCPLKHKPFPGSSWQDRYRNSLHYADQNIGHLLDFVDSLGLERNTLVIAVGDHGETTSSWPIGHGVSMTLEELRVPLILANGRILPEGEENLTYTQHIDLAPTILGLLGIPAPQEWLGRNLGDPHLPLRMFPMELEQSRLMGIVDNGLLYRFDSKSRKGALLKIDGDQLKSISSSDPANALLPAYQSRIAQFHPWVMWRHYERSQQMPANPATSAPRCGEPRIAAPVRTSV